MSSAAKAGEIASDARLSRRDVLLLILLAFVVMFEGFDVSVTSVVLPYVAKEFGAGPELLGRAIAAVGLGAIAAVFLLRLADRFGRRPILLLSTAGFAASSLATILATGLWHYALFQFMTRMLAVTQISVAYLIVTETLPPTLRGRANGLLGGIASLGAALPFMLLEMGLSTALGWRTLFLIGAAPLLVLPLLLAFVKETPAFRRMRSGNRAKLSWIEQLRQLTAPGLRPRFVLMSLFWLLMNFASGATSIFFTTYVVQERGWSPGDLALLGPAFLASAVAGNLLSGYLLDRIGRRLTISLFLLVLGVATQTSYSATDPRIITGGWIAIQACYGMWSAAFTLNSELFPTHLRAAANGMCNNLIGRWGMVAAPAAVGALSVHLGGVGPAAVLLASAFYAAIPLLWLGLPETRGTRVEENGA